MLLSESSSAQKPDWAFQHTPADLLAQRDSSRWKKYFTFAFVRNPWERMWSLYNFNLERKGLYHDDTGSGFDDFLMNKKKFHPWAQHFRDANLPIQRRPQVDWLVDKDGELLVDYVGRYETLNADFGFVCRKLGLEKPSLQHVHKTSAKQHYSEAFSKKGIAFIDEYYKKDIELFGYRFGD